MPVTSWHNPGTASSETAPNGSTHWTNPGNACAEDGVNATIASLAKTTYSHWLRVTNFGFSSSEFPEGAVITGILVRTKRSAGAANRIKTTSLWLRTGAGQVGTVKSSTTAWPTSLTFETFGSTSDTWGRSWSIEEITSTSFGVDLQAYNSGNATSANVDVIQVQIAYVVLSPNNATFFGCNF